MKKVLFSTLSLLMVLIMLFSFTACEGKKDADDGDKAANKDTVVGTWETTLDMADMLAEELGMEIDKALSIKMIFTFGEKGDASMKVDEDSIDGYVETLVDVTIEQACASSGMTEEDFFALVGMTKEEYIAQAKESMDPSEMNSEGTWEIDGDLLYFVEDGAEKTDDDAMKFSFKDGDLILDATGEEDLEEEEAAIADYMLPMTLKRVK